MTHPGSSNAVTLAALWVPVMPSTEGMDAKLKEAGRTAQQAFHEGFNLGGGPGGANELGSRFAQEFSRSFNEKLRGADLGLGIGSTIDRLSAQIDERLANRLKGQLPEAYRAAARAANELTEAEERLARATELVNDRTRTPTISAYVAARKDQYRAEQDVAAASTRASAAQSTYNEKLSAYNDASRSAFNASSMFAGMLGGAVVGGIGLVVGGMERLAELGAHVFEESIRGAAELGERLVDLGEEYEQINVQVVEFSGASGDALDQLQENARRVFGTLDVAGKNVGQTMSQLGSLIGLGPSQALDDLTRRVVDLQGRFTNLKTQDLGTIFHDFGIDADHVNDALATLLTNAANAGIGLGDLASSMSGDAAETLHEMGLSLGQAAHMMADLAKQGIPARAAMMGADSAMKVFAKDGLSFKDGMAEANRELQALGDTAAGNALAQQLFGRRWVDAIALVHSYNDAVAAGADAFDAPAAASDQFIDKTKTLENELEEFKHKIEDALEPFAGLAVDAVDHGLNHISEWFTEHKSEIVEDIKHWGDEFIDLLPKVKEFASVTLRLLEPLATGLSMLFAPVAEELIAASAGFLALTGHFSEAKDMLKLGVNLPMLEGKALQDIDKLADKIDSIKIDTDKIKDNFNNAADAANSIQPPPGFNWWNNYQSPANTYPNTPGQPGSPAPSGGPPGTMPFATPFNQPGAPTAPGQLPSFAPQDQPSGFSSGYAGSHADLWARVAKAESNGDWSNADTGHNGHYGGLQFSPSTWAAYGGLQFADRPDHATPDQQMIVADRTAFTGWQGTPPQGLGAWETITNGSVKTASKGLHVTGGTPGKDSVPILAQHGEYVWNTEAVAKYGPLIDFLNGHALRGFQGGGGVASGLPPLNTQGAQVDTIAIAEAVEQAFGITDIGMYRGADQFHEHSSGEAADVMVGLDNPIGYAVKDFALANAANFGVQYVIWQNKVWHPDGKVTNYGSSGSPTDQHRDHDHIATAGGGFPPGAQPGADFSKGLPTGHPNSSTPAPAAAAMLGGSASFMPAGFGGGMPGVAGYSSMGWGGAGSGGGMSQADQLEQQKRQRENQWRIDKINRDIQDKQAELNQARTELKALQDQETPLNKADTDAKIAQKNKQIKSLNDQLDDLNHQKQDAQSDIDIANARAAEPRGGRRGRAGRSDSDNLAEGFGRSFLGGISQSLGFPDVFGGKAPWDFGIVKLLGGLANWGFGMANAMGGAMNPGASYAGAGYASGVPGGLMPQIPGGGNIFAPGQPPGGTGPGSRPYFTPGPGNHPGNTGPDSTPGPVQASGHAPLDRPGPGNLAVPAGHPSIAPIQQPPPRAVLASRYAPGRGTTGMPENAGGAIDAGLSNLLGIGLDVAGSALHMGGQFSPTDTTGSGVPMPLGATGGSRAATTGVTTPPPNVTHYHIGGDFQPWHVNPSTDKALVGDVQAFRNSHQYAQTVANAPGTFPAV